MTRDEFARRLRIAVDEAIDESKKRDIVTMRMAVMDALEPLILAIAELQAKKEVNDA